MEACKSSFQELKAMLVSPPILSKPREGTLIIVYLSISNKIPKIGKSRSSTSRHGLKAKAILPK
ncbi:hypothetical protein CR513_21967, partial [Mucuna pruriens]